MAILTCGLAVLTDPPRADDITGRLTSPAVEDRRTYQFSREEAHPSGIARLDGTIPGNFRIRGMRWYVNGASANVVSASYSENQFSVVLQLPPNRDRWTVFAIADAGGFAHFIPMHDPILLSAAESQLIPDAESVTLPIASAGHARASLDYAQGDGGPILLASSPVLRWLSGSRITFGGWALDLTRKAPPREIFVAFDQSMFRAKIDADRPDVAKVFGSVAYTRSGFTVTIPSTDIRPGQHNVTVFVGSRPGRLYPTNCHLLVAISTM